MKLTGVIYLVGFSLLISGIASQSKDDEEQVEFVEPGNSVAEGSGRNPSSDDEDSVVEGSALPPSQVYSKQTTIVHARPISTSITTQTPPTTSTLRVIVDTVEEKQTESPTTTTTKKQEKKLVEVITSVPPAIPKITTIRPDNGPLALSNTYLLALLISIVVLIVIVIVIIVVCRRKHSKYTPGVRE